MQRITLDSPELSGAVRWSIPPTRGRQTRRTFSRIFAIDGIRAKNVQAYAKTRRYQSVSKARENLSLSFKQSVYKPTKHQHHERASRVSPIGVGALSFVNGQAEATQKMRAVSVPSLQTKSLRKLRSRFRRFINLLPRFQDLKIWFKRFNFNKGRLSIYGMASAVFVAGMWVAVDGYMTNRSIEREVLGVVSTPATEEESQIPVEPEESNTVSGSSYGSEVTPTVAQVTNHTVSTGSARYVRIPSLGVNSRIYSIGETTDGAVATPWGIHNVGWYDGSAKFTDVAGAAFLVGHVHGYTAPGVFYNLKNMKKDDIIEVELGSGKVMKFKVVSKKNYTIGKVDMVKALTPVNPDKFGLNLMTCGGRYDASSRQYLERILVRAEQI